MSKSALAKSKMRTPSANGSNGRDGRGRFSPGNPGGPGNPHAGAVGAWRSALAEAVTAEDVRKVTLALVKQAKAGERWAVKELLDRCLGRPYQAVEIAGQVEQEHAFTLPPDYIEFLDWRARKDQKR